MAQHTLDQIIHDLQSASNADELLRRLNNAFSPHGIVGTVLCSPDLTPPMIAGSKNMLRWAQHYDASQYLTKDPIVKSLMSSNRTVRWQARAPGAQFTPLERRIFGEAGEHGMQSGVSVPLFSRHGIGVLGYFSATELPGDHALLASLNYVALFAQEHLENSGTTSSAHLRRGLLSPRERDCLNWVKQGLTAFEIANRLHLSERTVVFHLQNAKEALGARNLPHAVARALAQGEITL